MQTKRATDENSQAYVMWILISYSSHEIEEKDDDDEIKVCASNFVAQLLCHIGARNLKFSLFHFLPGSFAIIRRFLFLFSRARETSNDRETLKNFIE